MNDFHKRQNTFVQEKMKIIPSVLNLSQMETPTAFVDCLSRGTKIVPHDQLCDYDYHTVMNQDLQNVIARCFCKVVGFWANL